LSFDNVWHFAPPTNGPFRGQQIGGRLKIATRSWVDLVPENSTVQTTKHLQVRNNDQQLRKIRRLDSRT
jgi:hypothetical protein